MRALDTNVIVRFLVNDDKAQGNRVRARFEDAERRGDRFFISRLVLLELIWVLSAVYKLTREEILRALELLTQMPILEFEDYDCAVELIRSGHGTDLDLPDLFIGLSARALGCEVTLTFERGLARSELFERV